jgi:hypothetical protein
MKALSQSEYGELRNLYESIYTPKVDLTEELLDEIFDELVDEYIEEGYSEEDAIEIVDEAVDLYIDEVLCEVSDSYYDSAVRASKKAAQGIDKAARQKRRAGQVRYAKRKAGEAFKRGKELAGAAKAGASLAKDFAGDELRRAGRKAKHSITSAPGKAKASVDRKKKGIKGFIKRQAQKVVDRMSEELEAIGEDSRRMSNKQHTQRVRSNIKSFGSNYTPPSNYDPDANRGQGEVLTRKQIEKKRRKSLRQEEFDAFDVVLEFLQVEGYAETLEEAEWIMANLIDEEAIDIIHEIDENRRMARDPEGRKSGHSKQPDPSKPGFTGIGNMSIDQIRKMSARIEKEKTKKEEAEYVDENRRAARAAGGSKDDSKKQPDPSKPGFTGIGNMSIDQIRKMSARIEKDKKEEFEAWFDEVLEAYKEPNLDKMRKQEYRHSKAAVKQRGGSRGSSKNRAFKMSSIRNALERGEDPRADSYGGKRTNPQDHRAAFSKNPLNNPPRRVKKPGV